MSTSKIEIVAIYEPKNKPAVELVLGTYPLDSLVEIDDEEPEIDDEEISEAFVTLKRESLHFTWQIQTPSTMEDRLKSYVAIAHEVAAESNAVEVAHLLEQAKAILEIE